MVEGIWKEQGMPKTIDKKVTQYYAKELWAAVKNGYGKDLIGIDYNSPDYEMLKNLQNNVYQFSAAKNYQQLKALTQALIGPDAKIRSYSEFKKAAFEINDTHVNQWLKTEYDTAIASGQMASKWVDIQAGKNTFPILEMDVVMDGRTSDICRPLHGVRKHVDDAFWNKYYPPNHFGCRSTVRKHSGGSVTPDNKIEHAVIPAMFSTNIAKDGLVFPKGHPYFNHVPENALLSFGDANYSLDTTRKLRGSEGAVYESGLAYDPGKKNDQRYYVEYQQRINAADAIASHFDTDVFLCPDFQSPSEDWRYYYFFKNVTPFSQPDFYFNKEYWELKSYEDDFKGKKIGRMLKRVADQGLKNAVIQMRHDVDMDKIKSIAERAIDNSSSLQIIEKIIVIDINGKVWPVK